MKGGAKGQGKVGLLLSAGWGTSPHACCSARTRSEILSLLFRRTGWPSGPPSQASEAPCLLGLIAA